VETIMRKDLQKLKDIRDNAIGLSMQIDILETEISIIISDVHYMNIAKTTLKENLRILKGEKVIAMANQYKKSVEELKFISDKIDIYERRRRKSQLKLEKLIKVYDIYTEEYEYQKKIVENQKVVLYFDVNRKKNEK
jgi:hypothetical protein